MEQLKDNAKEVAAWRKANNCDHVHCPLGCEHPQERLLDGVMVCGRCLFVHEMITLVEPCVPSICEDL
jgi:hypothetical protein